MQCTHTLSGNTRKVNEMKIEQASYSQIGKEVGALVDKKNRAYGNSFSKSGEILKILYPNGVQPDQYRDLLTTTRVLDKLFRIATRKDAFDESPWKDIAGYALLALAADENESQTL